MFYDGDGFWALDAETRAGLAALAVFSGGLLVVLVRAVAAAVPWGVLRALVGLCLGAAAYAAFLWLSPQLFQAYFRAMIPDLPAQSAIIWPPPGPRAAADRVIEALSFANPGLAEHARGLLGWLALLGGATAPGRRPAGAPPAMASTPEGVRKD